MDIKEFLRGVGLAVVAVIPWPLAIAEDVQPHAEIHAAVSQFVLEAVGPGADVRPAVKKLDSRLKLARCNTPLRVFWPPGSRKLGNSSVGVACEGSHPWKIYVQVGVTEFRDVVVTRGPIQKGQTLSAENLALAPRETSRLGGQQLGIIAPLIGQKARVNIKADTVVTSKMLEMPEMVSRGESVVILANAGGIEVRMTGEALADGMQGGVIKVRNLSSNRIVEGEVVGKGLVQVRF